ncbi:MAG: hypothetical protein K8S62_10260 [Candidatus Sabulitectum sp.]|nr:hypothetical protein [Candidatus Sabulitectum sp.]
MHKVLSLLVFSLFLIEEIFHQRLGKAGRLSSVPADCDVLKNNFDRYDLLRLLELLFLGLLLSTPAGNPASGHGQLSMILVGLQIARLFGRRVLSRWSVLGILQALEMIILLTIILIPIKISADGYPLSPIPLLALIGGVMSGILVTIVIAFSISYGMKLFSRESGNLYETFPPLADSESWAFKFSRFSLYTGTAGVTGLFLLLGLSLLPVLFSISLILQFTGVLLCRKDTYCGHHPRAHILWGISFLILYFLAVSGITTVNPAL